MVILCSCSEVSLEEGCCLLRAKVFEGDAEYDGLGGKMPPLIDTEGPLYNLAVELQQVCITRAACACKRGRCLKPILEHACKSNARQ